VIWVISILSPTLPHLDGELSPDLFHLLRASGSSQDRKVMRGRSWKHPGHITRAADDKVRTSHQVILSTAGISLGVQIGAVSLGQTARAHSTQKGRALSEIWET